MGGLCCWDSPQGACLTLEYAGRNARGYGGMIALSGGLIGPELVPERYPGAFSGSPIFLGCSDTDPHIPLQRIEESAAQLERMGANVTTRIYPGMGHTVNDDEIEFIRKMMAGIPRGSDG